MTEELCALGAAELGTLYRTRQLSPVDVVRATLDRIERVDPQIHSYITVLRDTALAAAKVAEQQLAAGIDLGPMHGVPFSVKDIVHVRGTRTTAASRVLMDALPDEADAEVVRRMRAGGAVLLGKVNLHELAIAEPDPDSPFGYVYNPRKLGRQCGGSSSGSAAATAAGLGVVSIATDCGGSIRHPASVCGVVGLKPTYGRVSTRGVLSLSVDHEHVGPFGRSVADVAAAMAVIAGYDLADPYSDPSGVDDYLGAIGRDVTGLRIGVPTNKMYALGHASVHAARAHAQTVLVERGLTAIPFELPRAELVTDVASLVVAAEVVATLERYKDREHLFNKDFAKKTQRGRDATAVEYVKGRQIEAEARRAWQALFERFDVMLVPANIAGAPSHGVDTLEIDGTTHSARQNAVFNRAFSFVGFPALCVPIGETTDGMPVGIQLVGPPRSEARLLAVGHALEQALGDLTSRWGIEPKPGDG